MRVQYLKHGYKEGGKNVMTLPDSLNHVMKMRHTKEQGTDDDCPEVRIITCNSNNFMNVLPLISHMLPSNTGTIQARNVNSSLNGATT